MTDPASYQRRILLAVTGLTPQIVTETLYALAVAGRPVWVPTQVRILTTRQGQEEAERALLSDDPGWFRRLREDYLLAAKALVNRAIKKALGGAGPRHLIGRLETIPGQSPSPIRAVATPRGAHDPRNLAHAAGPRGRQ
jgi:hypothetical protein